MNPVFIEEQYFRQRWLWLILAGSGFLEICVAVRLLATGSILIGALIICGAVLFLFAFWKIRLQTQVDAHGIALRFVPFSAKTIEFNAIGKAWPRQYKPIKEYGGWGLRSSARHGDAYNISGDRGVQLELQNGQKILIGSQRAEELARIIESRLPRSRI